MIKEIKSSDRVKDTPEIINNNFKELDERLKKVEEKLKQIEGKLSHSKE